MPLPQTTTSQITDQLNEVKDGLLLSEIAIQRLKSSIEKVKSVDLAQYYMLLGMFYSIFKDYEKSVDAHEKSLRLLKHSVLWLNYGYSMKRFGLGDRSFELMKKSFEFEPSDSKFAVLIGAAINSGNFDIEKSVNEFVKHHPAADINGRSDIAYIRRIRTSLEKAKISETDYKSSFALVEQVLAKRNYIIGQIAVELSTFDMISHVGVEISLDVKSADEMIRLQDEIAYAMADSEISSWDRIIFTVRPRSENQAA